MGVRVSCVGEQISLPKLSFALLIAPIEIAPSVGTTLWAGRIF